MAVPTISVCSPSVIFTGGQLVTLTGTNFRTAYPLPNVSGVLPVPPPTVSVTVNGQPADDVRVYSATSLTALVRGGAADAAAVIVVQNLDIAGAPIVGESVTVSGLATFRRADLSLETDFTRVTRTLIQMLQNQVIANVVKTEETDYADNAGGPSFDITHIATLPCLVLSGPTTKEDRFYDLDLGLEVPVGTGFSRRRMVKTVDLTYKITGYDDHEARSLNLLALVNQALTINANFYLPRDPADLTKGTVGYELECGDFDVTDSANISNVRTFSGDFTIKGFQYEDIAGFPNQMVVESGQTVDTVVVTDAAFKP